MEVDPNGRDTVHALRRYLLVKTERFFQCLNALIIFSEVRNTADLTAHFICHILYGAVHGLHSTPKRNQQRGMYRIFSTVGPVIRLSVPLHGP